MHGNHTILVTGATGTIGRPARTFAAWVADHAAAFRNGGPGARRLTGRVAPAVELPTK
jgi:hypothetical protein